MTINGTRHAGRAAAGNHLVKAVAARLDHTARPHVVAWLGHHPIAASASEGHVIVTTADNRVAAAVPTATWPQTDGTALIAKLEHQITVLDQVRQHLATDSQGRPHRHTTLDRPGPRLNL